MSAGMAASNSSDRDTSADTLPGLISESTYWLIIYVTLVLESLISVFATGANILTIAVYRKLGYSDSTNISLTALAISDLGVSLTTIVTVIASFLQNVPNLPFTFDIFYLLSMSPHVDFVRISALITTYISVERYLCVSSPLKIKRILTPGRTLVAMVMCYTAIFCLLPVSVLRNRLHWKFYPELNRSLFTMTASTDPIITSLYVGDMIYKSMILPSLTFVLVLSTTILLALSLKRNKAWRDANKSLPTNSNAARENKERKAMKLVMAIATVFIISSIPYTCMIFALIFEPGYSLAGRYDYLFQVTGNLTVIIGGINCSANVVIYYIMSSKFRQAMLKMMGRNF